MPNVFRKILHYKDDKSDKVYVVDINRIDANYVVSVTWGKRTHPNLSSQIRGTFSNHWSAERLAIKLVKDKYGGRTKYKDAPKDIQIIGLQQLNVVNAAHLHESNKKPVTAAVMLDIQETMQRSIKL